MEYTKDLILNVHYDEVTNTISFKKRTSKLLSKIKEHKIVITAITIGFMFITIDSVLLINFIKILENI